MAENKKEMQCDFNNYKRVRYFHGMLMSDRDFRDEQIYHQEKRKLLNRMLHSWGVVCGFDVEWETADEKKSTLKIKEGLALDCHGNEILVCEPVDIDIKTLILSNPSSDTGGVCKDEADKPEQKSFYLGIRYNEMPSDSVPVYSPTGGCDEKSCDYSRVREGFCIKLLEAPQSLPQKYAQSSGLFKELELCNIEGHKYVEDSRTDCTEYTKASDKCQCFELGRYCRKAVPCPDACPEEHYVILGKIVIDVNQKTVQNVCIHEGRTLVLSANLIHYLVSSTMTGLNEIFKVVDKQGNDLEKELPDPNMIHRNPIAAICWLLRLGYLDESIIERKNRVGASGLRTVFSAVAANMELNVLQSEMADLKRASQSTEITKLKKQIADLTKAVKDLQKK